MVRCRAGPEARESRSFASALMVVRRDINIEVDHAFRTWLIGAAQVGYGRDEYVGEARDDNRYFASIGAIYKLNREMQLKAQIRHDWLTSTQPGNAYESTSVLLTLRLQY